MPDQQFTQRMAGYGLTTAEIHYFLPDHPSLIQQFVWQHHDIAPRFPVLHEFLDFWRREIEAALHSIRIAHNGLVMPADWRGVSAEFRVH